MKTQGGGPVADDTEGEVQLAGRFLKKGFTTYQAKLLAIWEDKRIAAICSQMPNVTVLRANAAASLDRTALSAADRQALREYAQATAGCYCAGVRHAVRGGPEWGRAGGRYHARAHVRPLPRRPGSGSPDPGPGPAPRSGKPAGHGLRSGPGGCAPRACPSPASWREAAEELA